MKNRLKSAFISSCIIILLSFVINEMILTAEPYNAQNEITSLKKELVQARLERQKVKEDVDRDKAEFESYTRYNAARKTSIISETDSIKRLITAIEKRKDSLSAIKSSLSDKAREYELMQNSLRDHLVNSCKGILGIAKRTPPAVSRQLTGAISFLMNDLKTGIVDNIEGIGRFFQTIKNMDDAAAAIQTGQETLAPVQMRGNALMLRIGTIFEAVVDEDGKTGAIWTGNDSTGKPVWNMINDANTVKTIYKAVNMRESKAFPEFVILPYNTLEQKSDKK
jgi:hypothetical protein